MAWHTLPSGRTGTSGPCPHSPRGAAGLSVGLSADQGRSPGPDEGGALAGAQLRGPAGLGPVHQGSEELCGLSPGQAGGGGPAWGGGHTGDLGCPRNRAPRPPTCHDWWLQCGAGSGLRFLLSHAGSFPNKAGLCPSPRDVGWVRTFSLRWPGSTGPTPFPDSIRLPCHSKMKNQAPP